MVVKQEPLKHNQEFFFFLVQKFNYTIKGLYWSKHTEWSSSTGDRLVSDRNKTFILQ